MSLASTPGAGTWLLERAGVDDALAGDLAEQFAATPSAAWYWRQALMAIVVHWVETIRMHKWLAVRAIITGWVVWTTFIVIRPLVIDTLGPEWADTVRAVIRYGNWLVIGWTIGMLHRPYQTPMVFAYVVFMLVMSIPVVSRSVVEVLGHPTYTSPPAAMVALALFSLIAGGLLSTVTVRHLQRFNRRSPPRSAIG